MKKLVNNVRNIALVLALGATVSSTSGCNPRESYFSQPTENSNERGDSGFEGSIVNLVDLPETIIRTDARDYLIKVGLWGDKNRNSKPILRIEYFGGSGNIHFIEREFEATDLKDHKGPIPLYDYFDSSIARMEDSKKRRIASLYLEGGDWGKLSSNSVLRIESEKN